jgi:hypothetical protein
VAIRHRSNNTVTMFSTSFRIPGSGLRAIAFLALAAGSLLAYPSAGTLSVTGPSDLVGQYTFSGPSVPTFMGYGGGFKGNVSTADASFTQFLFCDDFSNPISVPTQANVNVSSLAGNSPNLSDTRFVNVTSWRDVTTVDPSLGAPQASTINNATALQRYQMAAYLITQYSFFNTLPATTTFFSDPNSRGVQAAIWAILNANGEDYNAPTGSQDGNIDTYLTNAANWLSNPSSNRSFLSSFLIVTDASVAQLSGTARLNAGLQELIVAVPEPTFYFALALGLGLLFIGRGKRTV